MKKALILLGVSLISRTCGSEIQHKFGMASPGYTYLQQQFHTKMPVPPFKWNQDKIKPQTDVANKNPIKKKQNTPVRKKKKTLKKRNFML